MYSASILTYSYLYAQIEDVDKFQMATGIVTAAMQLGKFVGDLTAQLVIAATGGSYVLLSYITVCGNELTVFFIYFVLFL